MTIKNHIDELVNKLTGIHDAYRYTKGLDEQKTSDVSIKEKLAVIKMFSEEIYIEVPKIKSKIEDKFRQIIGIEER